MNCPEIRNEEVKKICMEGNGGKPFLTPIGRRDLRGAFGVKLHPMLQGIDPSSEFLRPIYEWCQEEMAPLIVHLGFSRRGDLRFSDPLLIDPIASEYDFPIILAHMGSSRGFLWEKSKMVTLKNDNIILETSWAPKEVIKDALVDKRLVIGYEATLKALKRSNLVEVFVASNLPKAKLEELKHLCEVGGVKFEQLKLNNEELGFLCKKQYLISTLGIRKK